jgi:ATP-dependent Clp protease adaptor protein ClpS
MMPPPDVQGVMSEDRPQYEDEVRSEPTVELDEPPLYKVMLLNDDYTTMDFVVEVLKLVFNKSDEDAHRIMMNVHLNGFGVCGIYPLEIAESKVDRVDSLSREKGFPLKCTIERE